MKTQAELQSDLDLVVDAAKAAGLEIIKASVGSEVEDYPNFVCVVGKPGTMPVFMDADFRPLTKYDHAFFIMCRAKLNVKFDGPMIVVSHTHEGREHALSFRPKNNTAVERELTMCEAIVNAACSKYRMYGFVE
jgi:hypothetical protein